MKRNLLLSILSLGMIAFVLMSGEETAHTLSGNPPGFNAGAPGQSSCTNSGCHATFDVNSGSGSVAIGFGDGTAMYEAGETYSMSVTIEQTGAARFGFQLCAVDGSGSGVGSFTASGANTTTQSSGGIDFVNHQGAVVVNDMHTYTFDWTAPSEDAGAVTFYVAGMAANNAVGNEGDRVYTTSSSVTFMETVSDVTTIDGKTWGFYPNPATNMLTVELPTNSGTDSGTDSGTASVYSVDGKLAQTWALQQGTNSLDLSVNAGVYILNIQAANGESYTERLIVE